MGVALITKYFSFELLLSGSTKHVLTERCDWWHIEVIPHEILFMLAFIHKLYWGLRHSCGSGSIILPVGLHQYVLLFWEKVEAEVYNRRTIIY